MKLVDDYIDQALVTINDAATILGVSRSSVFRALARGDLERVRLTPDLVRVSMVSIEGWIEESTESPAAAS